MSKKKIGLSLIAFLSIVIATMYVIFSKNNIQDILKVISMLKIETIIIIIALIFLYFLMQGIYMKLMLKTLEVSISMPKGIFYSVIEFFFSGITPSSTGGQPVQLYYMHKDKIPNEKSIIVLTINTILFKLFLVVFGGIIILNKNIFKTIEIPNYIYVLFGIGIIVDIVMVIGCYLILINKKIIGKILKIVYTIINKLFRKNIDIEKKKEEVTIKYGNDINYLKKHKKEILIGTVVTFIQRVLLFSITYFIYIEIGKNGISYWNILLMQIFIQITAEGMPFPGGTGLQEIVTVSMYDSIFDTDVVGGMLLIRVFSFYIPLLASMIIIILNKTLEKKRDFK